METMKARRSWRGTAETKGPWMQAQTTIPRKLSFIIEGENKIFHDQNRFKQYISTNPALQKVLEGKPQPKEAKTTHNNTDI